MNPSNVPIDKEALGKKVNNIRQIRFRNSETTESRTLRLHKLKTAARTRRANETNSERSQRLLKAQILPKRKRETIKDNMHNSIPLSNLQKAKLWRLINQNIEPHDIETYMELESLAACYERDLKRFKESTISPLYNNSCSVCGLVIDGQEALYDINDEIFNPLRIISPSQKRTEWTKYNYKHEHTVYVCRECIKILKKKSNNIPRLCRANIPLPDPRKELENLTFIEQMLISPVLPMVFVCRYKTFGQYQSKGQCVGFVNRIHRIAKILPRTLEEVFVNIKDLYGHADFCIRIKLLRDALIFLKSNHLAYESIYISEENLRSIEENKNKMVHSCSVNKVSSDKASISATQKVLDAGQNQNVEEYIAQVALTSPLAVEAISSKEEVSKTVKSLFRSMAQKESQIYTNHSILEGWSLMFPCLLWEGKGGPDNCIQSQISLREWINYVIRIPSLDFRKNIIFISFANIVLRRQRITGLTAHKPICKSVEEAVKELIQISHSSRPSTIPDSTLNALSRKVGTYVDQLPGSLSDMKKFRNDILSMMKKHDPPSYFLTLSSADSMWAEGFVAASKGRITIEEAKQLSASERADLMAQNPFALTITWKRRIQAFLDFVIKVESKPLGKITHYVQKAEWQGRLSEHAHFLFWTEDGIPPLKLHGNGDLDGQQKHITFKSEAVGSAMIHIYENGTEINDPLQVQYSASRPRTNSSANCEESYHDLEMKAPTRENIFNSVTDKPSSLHHYFHDSRARRSINDLVRSVNLHICSAYCTNGGKSFCKSRFLFQIRKDTIVKKVIDKSLNKSYRINLRRNHSRINPYSLPILNFWRANMDLTVLCGSPFASIVYVTYYTSKLDKSSNIRDVLHKVKNLDENTELKKGLRKLLVNMDTCRATGLPEASSNLLLFSHRYTSSRIVRLDTRAYLPKDDSTDNEISETSETLNSLLHSATKGNEGFAIPEPEYHVKASKEPLIDTITQNYFNRPSMLYDTEQNKMIDSSQLSMAEYIEKYKVTQKRTIKSVKQSRDKRNKIVEPRDLAEQDIVLDLKFRISPPDPTDPKWCAGTLALHIPHVSIEKLLTIDGKRMNLVEAYEYYYTRVTVDENLQSIPLYPLLHKYEINELDLFTATNATKHLPLNPINRKQQNVPDDIDKLYDVSEDIEDPFGEDLDPDDYSPDLTNASTNLENYECKSWNRSPQRQFLSAENPWSGSQPEATDSVTNLEINEPSVVSEEHKSFMSLVKAGNNPGSSNENVEAEQALLYAKGNRKLAACHFLNRTTTECKNNEQRNVIKKVTDILEAYYYGKYSSRVTEDSVEHTPIMTMIGVPGAGESWVVGKIRTWVDIRFNKNDFPYKSSEFKALNQEDLSDLVSSKVSESLTGLPKGKYGKSAALSLSGSAAEIVKGFTVHHGFSFPVNINKEVKTGELPLPELKASNRTKLLECWCSVKLIIIDEVYMLKVEWLSLIDEKLRQIFNSDLPFAGIPILIAGDPRQIVPVNGKALFTICKYFNLEEKPPFLNTRVTEREEKGFLHYGSSKFAIPLTKSVRISNKKFADINMKIGQYNVTAEDLKEINKFYQPMNILQKPPWIDSPWLFPTWKKVNEHLQFVTERAKNQKGIFRAWCPVTVESSQPLEDAKKAIRIFYKSSTFVSAKFTCSLPYIDFFIGQIVCLKKNWNPTWNLFNNAKAFVVGIRCQHPDRQGNPLMTLDEAVDTTLTSPDALKYDLLIKPLIPFTGPSALSNTPGIMEVPWVKTNRKIAGCKMAVHGPCLFPANAFSHHQSQGSTFDRSVSCINETCKAYGMANVVTSRTVRDVTTFAMPYAISELLRNLKISPLQDLSRCKCCNPVQRYLL